MSIKILRKNNSLRVVPNTVQNQTEDRCTFEIQISGDVASQYGKES